MATISQTRESSANIRVALVIESGKLKPVWLEQTDNRASDRIFVKEICSVWTQHQGCQPRSSTSLLLPVVTVTGSH
jgi:hypothetical protein